MNENEQVIIQAPKQQQIPQETQPIQQLNQQQQQQQQQQEKQYANNNVGGLQGASSSKFVDVLIIGGGPASLGILVNAVKTNRLNEFMQGDGVAIIDSGLNFGGGLLSRYGINSNTSGGGFLKCTYKKIQQKDGLTTQGAPYAQKGQLDKKGNKNIKTKTLPKKKKQQEENINRQQVNPTNTVEKRKTLSNLQNQQCIQQQNMSNMNPTAASTMRGPALENALQTGNPYVQSLMQTTKPQKKDEVEILPPYRDLYNSHIGKVLKEFGKNTIPLGVIGHFLNYAGNHLLNYIYQTTKKKIFYPLHKAVSIQLMQNGEILTKVRRQQVEVNEDGEFVQFIETDQIVCFRSKALVIANGGVQGLHPDLFKWFPNLDPSKTLASDSFLRSYVYLSTMRKIKEQNLKKIVIIGGSHSGFSCAWMLLNGPATYYKNNAGISVEKEPNAQRKQIKNCPDCCQCGVQQQVTKKAKINEKIANASGQNAQQFSPQMKGGGASSQQSQPLSKAEQNCSCACICFGFFQYDDWNFDYQNMIPDYEDYAIEILYRDHIRVFYNKVSDAEQDGYTEFESDKFQKKDGYLYSFTGLRGDAKDLYLKIQRGQEKRVALIQAKTVEEQRQYVERADVVIWACGYQTSKLIIKDTDRRKLNLSQKVENTQYDVDGKCRLMLADGQVLAKVFGCGIAYPVRTKDGMMVSNPNMTNPRADSFSLYMNFVGDQLLKNLLPKQKYAKNSIHKLIPQKKITQVDNNQMSQKNYQQIVKVRLQQYKSSVKQALETHDDRNVLRHKSLNAREEFQNNLRKSQLQVTQLAVTSNKNQESQEFQIESQLVPQQQIQQQNIPAGSKSVDRAAHKNGSFQNKLAQMAKSPQILQKKQQIMNSKNSQVQEQLFSVAENQLNSDIMPLINHNYNGVNYQQQQHIKQIKIKNEQLKKIKSPYNQGQQKATNKLSKFDKIQEIAQSHTNVPSRQGRDIVRSSQANRKQDLMKSNEPLYKMQRQSQAAFTQQTQKQNKKQNRQSLHSNQLMFNNQLYNSSGASMFPSQADQMSSLRSEKQGVELPPILHPLNQNHYFGMQQANQMIASEYYLSSNLKNDLQMQSQTQYEHHLTQNNGGDDLTPLTHNQHSSQPHRQFSFTQHESYNQQLHLETQDRIEAAHYEQQSIDPQLLHQLSKQGPKPQHSNHDKKPSQVLYVEQDDYLSDDSITYKIASSNKKKAQTFHQKFKNLNLNDNPYQSNDEDDEDLERRHESNANLNDDNSDGHSSHYNDDHFENDEDPFGDVSSEGSCIQSNSFKRSQLDRSEQQYQQLVLDNNDEFNVMDEYDCDNDQQQPVDQDCHQQDVEMHEDENVDIPDEELQDSPRKSLNNLQMQDKEFLSGNKKLVGVTQRRILENRCQQEESQLKANLQTNKIPQATASIKIDKAQKFISGVKAYNNVDMKKITKKQLSPVLLNRNSSNNLSNHKPSMRDSQDFIRDAKQQTINSNNNYGNKAKYLNVGSNNMNSNQLTNNSSNTLSNNGTSDVQMQDLSQGASKIQSLMQMQNQVKTRPSKSIKQATNASNYENKQDKAVNYVRRNYLGQNQNNNQTYLMNNSNSYQVGQITSASQNQSHGSQHSSTFQHLKSQNNLSNTLKKKVNNLHSNTPTAQSNNSAHKSQSLYSQQNNTNHFNNE
eukprot:403363974